ncbi:MAG TPA: hypothetical protein VFN25_05420 [Dokdonella sp.]|uniref:hypothetical protein n=1 Tax=Dokdonella sp. TaxID=2291710 RepID=UPI002D7E9D32|nr:hypothetical protein [Dokdonella sp.]HET9032330.1 hypothetical protein [Dokdonella sp.]
MISVALSLGCRRAELLLATAKPNQAIEVLAPIEALARQHQDSYCTARSQLLHGQALMQLDQIDEGLALMRKASDYFQSKGQVVDVLDGLDRRISVLRDKQRYALAVDFMEQRQKLWTQLFRNERGRAIAEVEARHSSQQLESRIDALSIENRSSKSGCVPSGWPRPWLSCSPCLP